jgi:catechol 2,3-dioxygenase-like lactoylglutathione lyase family enzyme
VAVALIQEFGHVTYAVTDLDRAVAFLRETCQLEVNERRPGTVFLTADTRHHWVRLEQRPDPGLIRLGFRTTGPDAIETIVDRLDARGISWTPTAAPDEDRLAGAVRFTDPDGIEIEIYENMWEVAPSPAIPRGIVCLLHAVMSVPDPMTSALFYEETLGLHRSDRIQDLVVFLRAGNLYHHSLAFAKSPGPVNLDHVAFLVRDFDVLMRFRAQAQRHGVLNDDVVKHLASNSASVYLSLAGASFGAEFCTGHDKITDDSYRGRVLQAGPATVNVWSDPFPSPGPRGAARPAPTGGTAAAAQASAQPQPTLAT